MAKLSEKMRSAGKSLVYFLGGILLFIVMGAAIHHENEQTITGYEVTTVNKDGNNFVDDSDIYTIIKNAQYTSLVGTSVQKADLERLTGILDNNPYIKRADVYVGADGKVIVKIYQHSAILRVINNTGVSFYLDENGDKMPSSDKFTPRVEVATGLILDKGIPNDTSDGFMRGKLMFLAKKIESNPFMNALVQQIYVNENRELELVPAVGNFSILIGDTDRLDGKFADLESLYKAHPDDFPWNAYVMLNIKYAHQVIGVKNSSGAVTMPVIPAESTPKPTEVKPAPGLDAKQTAKLRSDSVQAVKAEKKKEEKVEKKEKKDKKKKHKKDSQ